MKAIKAMQQLNCDSSRCVFKNYFLHSTKYDYLEWTIVKNIIEQLLPIFRNEFDDEDLIISALTTAQDISGWDSLAQIRLILAIEKNYDLHFSAAEISDIENVGQMVELILSKQENG